MVDFALHIRPGVDIVSPVRCTTASDKIIMTSSSSDSGHGRGIPFNIEINCGSRPVVSGRANEMIHKFQIHSNAGFYLQLSHRKATDAGVDRLQHTGAYGIVSAGNLSSLGRDEGVLRRLSIGEETWHDVPASIFETMGDDSQGMLGLKWIEKNGVVMNFSKQLLWVKGQVELLDLRRSLMDSGYEEISMCRDQETGRYFVNVTINNKTRSMVVSTVADLVLDAEFARTAEIKCGGNSGQSFGPTGAIIDTHAPEEAVQLTIGTWTSAPMVCRVEDIYDYMASERPSTDPVGGMLGADFLIMHKAVVDFGSRCLYLAPDP